MKTRREPKPEHRRKVIWTAVSDEEHAAILADAARNGQSASRYLLEAGLRRVGWDEASIAAAVIRCGRKPKPPKDLEQKSTKPYGTSN